MNYVLILSHLLNIRKSPCMSTKQTKVNTKVRGGGLVSNVELFDLVCVVFTLAVKVL